MLAAAVALAHQQGGGDGLDGDVGGAVAGVRAGAVRGGLTAEGHAEIDVRAGAGFDDAVVRGKPGQLAGAAERGDDAVYEAWIPRGERLVAERPAQAGRAALGLEQHVGRIDQGGGRVTVRGDGRVEHDAACAPVPQPPGGQGAAGVAAWRLDPDHLGSVVREQQARHVQSGC